MYRKISQLSLALAAAVAAMQVHAQAVGESTPAPPSIGADVPVTYFGPAPSSVNPALIGPYQLLKSGTIDFNAGTITLPLYKGQMASGETVWYVLTDTTDKANAQALGLNHSAKLAYADVGLGVRPATQQVIDGRNVVIFQRGKVDFSTARNVVPGDAPNYFPPKSAVPGAVGDANYSPLMKLGSEIYNAPVVSFGTTETQLNAFCDGNVDYKVVHDKATKICPRDQTVTLQLTQGFSFGRPVLYLSTDANNNLPAALEGAVLAPGLQSIKVGDDDSAFSAVERLFAITNGPTNNSNFKDANGNVEVNPQRQGFNSALSDGKDPLNVLGGIPTIATDYSPLWDLNVGEWTAEAISKNYRSRVKEEFRILGLVRDGWIKGPGGKAYGSSGLIVNCPIVSRFL